MIIRLLCLFLFLGYSFSSKADLPFFGVEESATAKVANAYIEMRTGPGSGYPIFYIAERGEKVYILKQRTDWFKVRTQPLGPLSKGLGGDNIPGSNTKQGWVHISQIAELLDNQGQVISLNNPKFDDFSQRKWEGGFMVGSFGSVDEITAYGGYHFSQNFSLELALSESFGDFSNGMAASINIVHQPFPKWRYSPFFTLGGGVRKTDPKSNLVSTEDRTDDTLNAGIGVSTYITRRLLLRLQYKNHTVLTSRDDDEEVEEWKIGLSAFF